MARAPDLFLDHWAQDASSRSNPAPFEHARELDGLERLTSCPQACQHG
jgi:hypothetical protein